MRRTKLRFAREGSQCENKPITRQVWVSLSHGLQIEISSAAVKLNQINPVLLTLIRVSVDFGNVLDARMWVSVCVCVGMREWGFRMREVRKERWMKWKCLVWSRILSIAKALQRWKLRTGAVDVFPYRKFSFLVFVSLGLIVVSVQLVFCSK